MSYLFTVILDDLDLDAVRRALAFRQTFRTQTGVILPDGESDLSGALLAEVCRGWLEMLGEWPSKGENP